MRYMAPVGEMMASRLRPMDPVDDFQRMRPVPLRRAGVASLDRAHEREHQGEGDGEQQYEKADRPHEKNENSRRWARPSQSAAARFRRGSALQHRATVLVSPEWVSLRSFRQVG